MPQISKLALSRFVRTECKRQLRFHLSPATKAYRAEREAEGMPPKQPPRPGFEYLVDAGKEWEAAKVADLAKTLHESKGESEAAVIGEQYEDELGRLRYREIELAKHLPRAHAPCFIVEGVFDIGPTFERALDIEAQRQELRLDYARLRPDLLEVAAPGTFDSGARVAPDGRVEPLDPSDDRVQLRAIDIKLTAEPSPAHFSEVTLYSMALAGWLEDRGLAQKYVVVPEAALWPGSHEASSLVRRFREIVDGGGTPTFEELREALVEDLEVAPFEVFSGRVRQFLVTDVPEVLSAPWRELPWHVDARCIGCDFLGHPWLKDGKSTAHPDHCRPTAETAHHLSRVAFISRGACDVLRERGVADVTALSTLTPADDHFEHHHLLQATRTVISGRAQALEGGEAHIPDRSGTSAVMPKWAALRIYLTADFDVGSAITLAFGLKAFWVEPKPFGSKDERKTKAWKPKVFVVDQKSIHAEERELLALLDELRKIMTDPDVIGSKPPTTIQFYIWDRIQQEHLARVIGRHLTTILNRKTLAHLAWLFPPEELLPNPDQETRRSPITVVKEVVRNILAAPIPHYYTLLQVARMYHPDDLPEKVAAFSVHPLFEDQLSEQVPSERAHEIWARLTEPRHWFEQQRTLVATIERRLGALEAVVKRLESDLRDQLGQNAAKLDIQAPRRLNGASWDGQLWYAFARLNAALAELEIHQIRAMPPQEREARFRSAWLRRRLSGDGEREALQTLGLENRTFRWVYVMDERSKEVKLREGDFNLCLSPRMKSGFLDRTWAGFIKKTPLAPKSFAGWEYRTTMDAMTSVTVAGLDRDRRLIALDLSGREPATMETLERHGLADFSRNVSLDPTASDFFTRKLKAVLRAIGTPAVARDDPLVRRATGLTNQRRGRETRHTPAADVLWEAAKLHAEPVERELAGARAALEARAGALNDSQWAAWEAALTRRLQLIWGPPGTGKSRTLRAIALGAIIEAVQNKRTLRVLIAGPTYNAMDNVLLEVHGSLGELIPEAHVDLFRVRSAFHLPDSSVPEKIDVEINKSKPSPRLKRMMARLKSGEGVTVVGATPEQTFNLLSIDNMRKDDLKSLEGLFDLILLDEASQVDVGHAILIFAALAEGGSVVVAGDPMQLPPIHQAEAPLELEAMVGSTYSFFKEIHRIHDQKLTVNYRSNETIVAFERSAGYPRELRSSSPELRLRLVSELPAGGSPPKGWPLHLAWSGAWARLLEPSEPATCFVYREGRSSQWNPFEARSVASVVRLLVGRLARGLDGELDPVSGAPIPSSDEPYDDEGFWGRGVGIVTPHRAQQALIVSQLQRAFPGVEPALIRGAVDTVERFQGQQRDVIIASFALGDQDAIRDEDEFLLSLNRFNVMASRARAKLIVFVTQELVDYLSSDLDVLRGSRLLKSFAELFCTTRQKMELPFRGVDGETHRVVGELRSA